jgi:hypothetical protein
MTNPAQETHPTMISPCLCPIRSGKHVVQLEMELPELAAVVAR